MFSYLNIPYIITCLYILLLIFVSDDTEKFTILVIFLKFATNRLPASLP